MRGPVRHKTDAQASPGSPGAMTGLVLQSLLVEQPAVCNLLAGEDPVGSQHALIGLGKGTKAKRIFF